MVRVAILAAVLALTACQSDATYLADQRRVAANAAAVDLNPDTLMDGVCQAKLRHLETLTNRWRHYCEKRGFVAT